jgi:septum formation protein
MKMPPLILASVSPRRADLLRQLGLDFKVVPSSATEIHHDQLTAREVAQINGYRKARAVAKKFPDALVLGADTVVHTDSAMFGKPKNLEEAYQMLETLQGRTHEVVTAVCLLNLRHHRQQIFTDNTFVTFRPLDAVKIRRYLTKVDPLDKAGAYAIQEEGDLLVERVAGSFTNVVGLPLEKLRVQLAAFPGFSESMPGLVPLLATGVGAPARSRPAQLRP